MRHEPPRRRRRMRASAAVVALLLVGGALTGCAPSGQRLDTDVAEQLQASVLAVSSAAAAGDFAGALTALDALEAQLTEGTASGSIDPGRSARIRASIELVRADLVAVIPVPAPEPKPDKPDKPGKPHPKPPKDDAPGKDKP